MVAATPTHHPLPFELLELKRFGDLVLQLAYDFRPWRQLEPTRTSGSGDGLDICGSEIVGNSPGEERDEDEHTASQLATSRLWLIQFRPEKGIGPRKLTNYLKSLSASSLQNLHGLIFAAPCNFSKKSIDAFHDWCSTKGIQEFHLWGHAAIEDFLYQPKNDHLLFAYFGLSHSIGHEKVSSSIRRVVSLKRKLKTLLPEAFPGTQIVLRDVTDDRYPDTQGQGLLAGGFLWLPCYAKGIAQQGLRVLIRQHWAYYDYKRDVWDFASGINLAIPEPRKNPWYDAQVDEDCEIRSKRENDLRQFWSKLPTLGQQRVSLFAHIDYDDIIEIDDVGDDLLEGVPTIFVNFGNYEPPFSDRCQIAYHAIDDYTSEVPFRGTGHVRLFPDRFRDVEWEHNWFRKNNFRYATDPYVVPITKDHMLDDAASMPPYTALSPTAYTNSRSLSWLGLRRSLVEKSSRLTGWPFVAGWWPLRQWMRMPGRRATILGDTHTKSVN